MNTTGMNIVQVGEHQLIIFLGELMNYKIEKQINWIDKLDILKKFGINDIFLSKNEVNIRFKQLLNENKKDEELKKLIKMKIKKQPIFFYFFLKNII